MPSSSAPSSAADAADINPDPDQYMSTPTGAPADGLVQRKAAALADEQTARVWRATGPAWVAAMLMFSLLGGTGLVLAVGIMTAVFTTASSRAKAVRGETVSIVRSLCEHGGPGSLPAVVELVRSTQVDGSGATARRLDERAQMTCAQAGSHWPLCVHRR